MTRVAQHSLGLMIRGAAASAPGTLAMDKWLYRDYLHDGGETAFPAWESSEGLDSWDDASAPALVAKKLLEAALGHAVAPRHARTLNNATHMRFGLANGAAYGLLVGSRHKPTVWFGVPFGAAVWVSGYVVLPLLGGYKPIWEYDLETLWKDLDAHLVFGTATAAAFCLLDGGEVDR